MSRFNTQTLSRTPRPAEKISKAGGTAYDQNDKAKLAHHLLTSFVKDQFYRSEADGIKELRALIRKVDPLFAAKAAVFARNEFNMRSVSHIVGAEIPAIVKGEKWTKNFIDRVIARPDDATEILSLYLATHGKPVPNSLKKGLARGLSKFDEYQLAKYRSDKKGVSLVDVVNLVHVKPSEKNRSAFEKLVDGELRSTQTWEAKLSEAGKEGGSKADAWGEMIEGGRLGYMAALRNIRNIVKDAPDYLDIVLEQIANPHNVRNGKQLPFRYISAMDAIIAEGNAFGSKNSHKILEALNAALEASFENVPVFDGETLIAIDRSSSMTMNRPGSKPAIDLALPLAVGLIKKNHADIMLYESDARYVQNINPADTYTTIAKTLRSQISGGGTNVASVFTRANRKYDRIIILSDNESWRHNTWSYRGYGWDRGNSRTPEHALDEYSRRSGKRPFVYAMDMAGYGDLQFSEKNSKVANIAGFSDKIFNVMQLLEQDRDALVHKIEEVVI